MRLIWNISLLSTVFIAILVGCGGGSSIEESRTALSGTVTVNGQPLPGGSVSIVSAEDPRFRVTTMIQEGGAFSVANAPRGAVKLAVETESLKLGAPPEVYIEIPRHYADADTSTLTADVQPGGEPLLIKLQQTR